jgi:uncharacterized membrane protein
MAGEEAIPAQKRPMHDLEAHVASLLRRRTAHNLNELVAKERRSVGERVADRLTVGAGSWRFIIGFLCFLAVWMAVNAVAWLHHWDPYPFILLNLVLSCVAALQAPVILMSQNREESRDRIRAEADYQVNLKTELLLEHLTHEVEGMKDVLEALRARGSRDSGQGVE